MSFVLTPTEAAPPLPPGAVDPWPGLAELVYVDWAGREWSLMGCGDGQNGISIGPRVRGFDFGSTPHDAVTLAGVDGADYVGYTTGVRDVWMMLSVFHGGGTQEWIDHDGAVRSAFLPAIRDVSGRGYIRSYGTLRAKQPSGETRWLDLWPVHDGSNELTGYGWLFGWETYGQSFTAYRPFWRGAPTPPTVISADESPDFWSGDPYRYAASRTFGEISLDNPGDEWTYPEYVITGPCTSVTVGPTGRETVIPVTLTAGQTVSIVTDPLERSVTREDGTELRLRMGGWPFAPIPPMSGAHVTVELAGTGSIAVTLTPRYHRYAG